MGNIMKKEATTSASVPESTHENIFVSATDGKLKRKSSGGAVTNLEPMTDADKAALDAAVAAVLTKLTDPMTTNGDLITRAAGVPTRLPIGANGKVLTVSGGAPQWITPSGSNSDLIDAWFTDFISVTAASGILYCDYMVFAAVSSGTGSGVAGFGPYPGIDTTYRAIGGLIQQSGTTSASGHYFATSADSYAFGFASHEFLTRAWMNTLGTAIDTVFVTFGFIDDSTVAVNHVDGAYFLYDGNGVNLNWQCVTTNNSVRTISDSGIPVAALTDHVFNIVVNEAGTEALFYIDGVLVQTHTTNIPTTRKFAVGSKTSKGAAGATNRFTQIDYMACKTVWSSNR